MNSQNTTEIFFADDVQVKRPYIATGLIKATDPNGNKNLFRVFISGTTKAKVIEYIDYLKNKPESEPGIIIEIRTLSKEEADEKRKELDSYAPPKYPLTELSEEELLTTINDFNIEMSQLRIGVSRYDINTPTPYEINYIIDPPVSGGKTAEVPFNARGAIEVGCEVIQGEVHAHLQEVVPGGIATLESKFNLKKGSSNKFLNRSRQFVGSWRVLIEGVDLGTSEVTIRNSRQVLGD